MYNQKDYDALRATERKARKALKLVKENLKKKGEKEYKCHLSPEWAAWKKASDERIVYLLCAKEDGITLKA